MELLEQIWTQRFFLAAVILFCIGAFTLFFHPNLIKKIIGFDLMDGAIYLMLTSVGYVRGGAAPIVTDFSQSVSAAGYVNPIPSGLVLTGIVVSVSVTAFALALVVRIYKRYHTVYLDVIMAGMKKGAD
ncbi:MAG: cation:proton antiporter subunit C [Oscillospiraceae bacterium]|nr:cation:proton antiporter subunit C [Oscillospiraceae bacterium]